MEVREREGTVTTVPELARPSQWEVTPSKWYHIFLRSAGARTSVHLQSLLGPVL